MPGIYKVITPNEVGKGLAFNPITNLLDVQLSDDVDNCAKWDNQNKLKVIASGRQVFSFDPVDVTQIPATLYLDDGSEYYKDGEVKDVPLIGFNKLAPIGYPPVNTGAILGRPTLETNSVTGSYNDCLFDIGVKDFTVVFKGDVQACSVANKQINMDLYLIKGKKPPEQDDNAWFEQNVNSNSVISNLNISNRQGISSQSDANTVLKQVDDFDYYPSNGYIIEPICFSIRNNKLVIFNHTQSVRIVYDLLGTQVENLDLDEMTILLYVQRNLYNGEESNPTPITSDVTVSIYSGASYTRSIKIPAAISGTIDINTNLPGHTVALLPYVNNMLGASDDDIVGALEIESESKVNIYSANNTGMLTESTISLLQPKLTLTFDNGTVKHNDTVLLTYKDLIYFQYIRNIDPTSLDAINNYGPILEITLTNFNQYISIENEFPDTVPGSMVHVTDNDLYHNKQLYEGDVFEIDDQNNGVLLYGAKHIDNIIENNNKTLATKLKTDLSNSFELKLPNFDFGSPTEYTLTADKRWTKLHPEDSKLGPSYAYYFEIYSNNELNSLQVYEYDSIAASIAKLNISLRKLKTVPVFNGLQPDRFLLTANNKWVDKSLFLQEYPTTNSMYNTINSSYVVGVNQPISNTDTLNQQLGKLQSQIDQTKTDLDSKEPTITTGTTSQYYRGDKTWQTLGTVATQNTVPVTMGGTGATDIDTARSNLGLGNNSDVQFNTLKLNGIATSSVAPNLAIDSNGALVKSDSIYNTVNSTYTIGSDTPISNSDTLNQQLGNLQAQVNQNKTDITNKEPAIPAGSAGQYWDGTKTWKALPTGLTNLTEIVSRTAPNNTIPAVGLKTVGSEANIDLVLSPKGTGAIIAQMPNSATVGGNKRGQCAVDLQLLRVNATQVAEGNYSVAMGATNTARGNYSVAMGAGNTASNHYSVAMGSGNSSPGQNSVAMGASNSSNGESSIAMGNNNRANNYYSVAMGSSNIAADSSSVAIGNSNTANNLMAVAIGDNNSASHMFSIALGSYAKTRISYNLSLGAANGHQTHIAPLRTTTANATTISLIYPVLVNSLRDIKGRLIAKNSSSTEFAVWDIAAILTCGSAASSHAFLGTQSITSVASTSGASSWTATLSVDSTGMKINVTGAASTAINWLATLYVQELY